jgi:SAM-dependent methyltransferase
MRGHAPVPPIQLARRVGPSAGDPLEVYEQVGRMLRGALEDVLPQDWSWQGKRVLDFGCGSARMLRHFLSEAEQAEFWGCDIDGPSIEWVQENLSPPLHCFRNDPEPPLPLEGGYFDLIWATSVFTHITDRWSDWLLELHRILAPGGLLFATYHGEWTWDAYLQEPYREDEVGMVVVEHWQPWDRGGPMVFHSEWWLRAHWGRAFEILEVQRPRPSGDGPPAMWHTLVLARKRPTQLLPHELERLEPDEPRELNGLRTNLRLVRKELSAVTAHPSRFALREAVLRSPLASPLRSLRAKLRR